MKISWIKITGYTYATLCVAFEWNLRRNKLVEVCYSIIIWESSKCEIKMVRRYFLRNWSSVV
jgi:hypothetical protein